MAKVLNKTFSKPVKPALESITLELSTKEAELVRFLAGRVMNGNGDTEFKDAGRSIWDALQRNEVASISDKVGIYTGWGKENRLHSLNVKKV